MNEFLYTFAVVFVLVGFGLATGGGLAVWYLEWRDRGGK